MLAEIDAYIDWVRIRSPQAKTWRDYSCDLSLFSSLIGDRIPTEVLPNDIDRFVDYQIGRGFKPGTVNRRLAAVGSFYHYLIKEGRAMTCPVVPKRHYLREPQRLPRPVNEKDLQQFFRSISDLRDLAMFTVMLRCGLRIGEVSALQMADLYLGEQPARLIIHGKGSKGRTVYVSSQAKQVLQAWLAQRPEAHDQHVFLSYRHKKLSTSSISKRVKFLCRLSGVDLTAHRLRHSYADHLLSAGMPITSIQKLMGHRFVETTQNYAAANDQQVQADFYRACEKLEGWKRVVVGDRIFSLEMEGKETPGEDAEEQTFRQECRIPPLIACLPGELARQLETYRQRKASRWRAERVDANSAGFYSVHGTMWKYLCEECHVNSASELHMDHVQRLIKARLDAGCSTRTVNGSLSSLHSFLEFLKEDQVVIHPSLDNIQRLQEDERLPRYISSEQMLRLQSQVEGNVCQAGTQTMHYDALLLRAMFYLLWQSGLRSGEVELLRFSDLYLSPTQAKRLFIRDGKWRQGRAVYLTDVTLEALRDYLAVRAVQKADDFVFLWNGKPLRKNFLSSRLKAVGRQVGVRVSAHRLRHTFATQLLNVGCRITSIQKLLGHTSLDTTMIYARAFDQTVMQDYFLALDTLESQPDGAWFGLNETPSME
jgi:site-specific recombinase XerD